ncbi:hypothetical protein [Bradyrhizobium murdochi]|uniref:hypothetical protein n=1 Tax=Bradyrhizobium murdochi TaxID=1038859 RepID=UPI0018DD12A8|nr:hypothetical protein [Bradyrhizobium murdochi]
MLEIADDHTFGEIEQDGLEPALLFLRTPRGSIHGLLCPATRGSERAEYFVDRRWEPIEQVAAIDRERSIDAYLRLHQQLLLQGGQGLEKLDVQQSPRQPNQSGDDGKRDGHVNADRSTTLHRQPQRNAGDSEGGERQCCEEDWYRNGSLHRTPLLPGYLAGPIQAVTRSTTSRVENGLVM